MAPKKTNTNAPDKPPIILPDLGVAVGFRPEYLDFERGIHVGNLEENERITRILKLALEARYGQSFVTERWGRGVYWKWIGYLVRANRTAKPISSAVSFGCSKFFLTVDTADRRFKYGLQIERGYVEAPGDYPTMELRPDWDWHRLLKALRKGSVLEHELERLVCREGFLLHAGAWGGESVDFSRDNYPGVVKLARILKASSKSQWAGFQILYAMEESEVRGSTGLDLVESILAVFDEVVPAMNLCMQVELTRA